MWQFLVRNCYSLECPHMSCIQLESAHAISSIFYRTTNLSNTGKFPEFKIRLLLVLPFLKTYIIRSRGSIFIFLSLGNLRMVPFIPITSFPLRMP